MEATKQGLEITSLKARNRRGFSLVEMVLALTLLGIIMVPLSQMFTGVVVTQRHLQQKGESENLKNSIQQLLTNPDTCATSLSALNPNTPDEQPLTLKVGDNVVLQEEKVNGSLVVSGLKAKFLQTSGAIRLVEVDAEIEKTRGRELASAGVTTNGDIPLAQVFSIKRYVNAIVTDNAVTGCVGQTFTSPPAAETGGLIRLDRFVSKMHDTGAGYRFTQGSRAERFDPTLNLWEIEKTNLKESCGLYAATRALGCHKAGYPRFTVEARGKYLTIQAYSGVCTYNESEDNAFGATASFRVTCGTASQEASIVTLSTMDGGRQCNSGGSNTIGIDTVAGMVCTIEPAIGWGWWPCAGGDCSGGEAFQFSAYPIDFSVAHYR